MNSFVAPVLRGSACMCIMSSGIRFFATKKVLKLNRLDRSYPGHFSVAVQF